MGGVAILTSNPSNLSCTDIRLTIVILKKGYASIEVYLILYFNSTHSRSMSLQIFIPQLSHLLGCLKVMDSGS